MIDMYFIRTSQKEILKILCLKKIVHHHYFRKIYTLCVVFHSEKSVIISIYVFYNCQILYSVLNVISKAHPLLNCLNINNKS